MHSMVNKVEHVLEVHNSLGEGPLWDSREQALYWVDIGENLILRFYPGTGDHETFQVDYTVSVLGLRSKGGFVLGTNDGIGTWDPESEKIEILSNPIKDEPESRFNDGAVDRQGRFWAGTYAKKKPTTLFRLDPDHSIHVMETGITVCNGIGWSPDNRTMYFTDTRRRLINAYDFDPTTGAIDNCRSFVHTPDSEDVPDGLTVDSEGFVWSARFGGWNIARYDPEGNVEREIQLPVKYPTSCTFGGQEFNDLYITTCRSYVDKEDLKNQPLAGDLFRLPTKFRGQVNPEYLG
jgi:sugar lactone lactonase YvrE